MMTSGNVVQNQQEVEQVAAFKIGEKVRFLHERQEGVVTRIINAKMLEVLVDDFLEMEVAMADVVRIDSAESVFRREDEEPETTYQAPTVELPPSFILIPKGKEGYDFYIVNPTRDELLFSLVVRLKHKYRSLNAGVVAPGGQRLAGRLDQETFNLCSKLILQSLRHPMDDSPTTRQPYTLEVIPKNDVHGQKPQPLEDLKLQGFRFVLSYVEPEVQEESEPENPTVIKASTFSEVPEVVDLHIHKIVKNPMGMDASTILNMQLAHFDRKLTDALMNSCHQIVFIHGIGDGVLKREIHSRLAGFGFVKSYTLADPLKYGNGATLVTIHGI